MPDRVRLAVLPALGPWPDHGLNESRRPRRASPVRLLRTLRQVAVRSVDHHHRRPHVARKVEGREARVERPRRERVMHVVDPSRWDPGRDGRGPAPTVSGRSSSARGRRRAHGGRRGERRGGGATRRAPRSLGTRAVYRDGCERSRNLSAAGGPRVATRPPFVSFSRFQLKQRDAGGQRVRREHGAQVVDAGGPGDPRGLKTLSRRDAARSSGSAAAAGGRKQPSAVVT